MKFGRLTPRKIFKFVATRCQTLRPKCTKINFGELALPSQTPWLDLRDLFLREVGERECGRGEGTRHIWRGDEGRR